MPRSCGAAPAAASAAGRAVNGVLRHRLLAGCLALLAGCLPPPPAKAGTLTQADIERRVRPPLRVAAQPSGLPAWPITSELEPDAGPVAWIFESIDLAPIPGFEGTPFNLLVSIDRHGSFLDVELLSQHEPVFLGGLGEAPLHVFLKQYAGLSLHRPITIASTYGGGRRDSERAIVLDGVAKATASIRIVNQTALNSALAVARARLGFGGGAHGPPAQPRRDLYRPAAIDELRADGSLGELRVLNRDAEALFAGREGEDFDELARREPDALLVTLYVAYLNAPTIGRAILGDARHAELMGKLDGGASAFWVATRGRASHIDERFVPGTAPPYLALSQDGLALELRDWNFAEPQPAGLPPTGASGVFVVPAVAGLDPARPMRFELTLRRAHGVMLPRVATATAILDYAPPAELFDVPPRPLPDWLQAWQARAVDLAVIGMALAALALVLARPRWISLDRRRLAAFRIGFLAFTLIFVGWYAQGQLSIVQLTGALKSLLAGGGLASFLYDPVSLLLIAFTAVSFVAWGRGTFCGWLCPFGALQEFAVHLRERLRLPELRLPAALSRRLAHLRYVVLAALLAAAAWAPSWGERMVEVEPFKTAITVAFDRSWPFVAWALALLAISAVIYKAFCRYLCPLGAAMALGGRLRLADWLPRRAACGRPCQMCRHRCRYEAIARDGAIRYDDCFQCLDCVGIYHDERRCAPLVLLRRTARRSAHPASRDEPPAVSLSPPLC